MGGLVVEPGVLVSEAEQSSRLSCSMFAVYSPSIWCLIAFSDIIRLSVEFFRFAVSGIRLSSTSAMELHLVCSSSGST